MWIIRASNLIKKFGNITALNGLNMMCPRGIVGLIGPNGAGKTTTIHLILGLIRPTYGDIYVFDTLPWRGRRIIQERVGVLLEDHGLPSRLTAKRYLSYIAKLRGVHDNEAEVNRSLSLLNLRWCQDLNIGAFSAGMKRRLGIAAAILGNPDLVILDEPSKSLDPLGRWGVFNLIRQLHREVGVNFLLSSHVLPELDMVCNWVVIIRNGRVVGQGYVRELVAKYPPRQFIIEVSDPQKMLEILGTESYIDDAYIEDTRINIKCNDIEQLYLRLPQIISAQKMKLMRFTPQHGGLMELYRNVIGEKGEK